MADFDVLSLFKDLTEEQAKQLTAKISEVLPHLREEVTQGQKENTMTLEDKGREARILERAAQLIEAEDAEEALQETQAPLIAELTRLYKHPTAYAERIKELEKQLGWDKSSSNLQWHGATNYIVK